MSLDAKNLKPNETQKKKLKYEAKAILATIDEKIRTAHDSSKQSIEVPVPIQFTIEYMSTAEIQRQIYYQILISLLKRNFIVEIDVKKESTIFYITWVTPDERGEIDIQNELLAKYTKKQDI